MCKKRAAAAASVGLLLVALASALGSASAWAETLTTICVPKTAGKPLVSGTTEGTCKNTKTTSYNAVKLPGASGLETLEKVLPHIKYVEAGVGGKPTIQFEAVNVQILSGAGKTNAAVNGDGNLVIGYDENAGKHEQTGSHNLVIGEEQTFTSYGGLLAGFKNSLTAPRASVTGGESNRAVAEGAAVSGGNENSSGGTHGAWVGGGWRNQALGSSSAVLGGAGNSASGANATVGGGSGNTVSGSVGSVSGGSGNNIEGERSWIGGGGNNQTDPEAFGSAIFGGHAHVVAFEYEAIP